jgi:putative polyhydroxyalkanoate system protein
MPDIDIRRAHNLGLKAARAAADTMAEHLGRKFGLKGDWSGNVLHFERPGVTGSLAVDDNDVRLTVTLGLLLKMMRASIEGAVHEEMDKLFARAPSSRLPASGKPGQASAPKGEGARSKKAPPRPKKGG